MYKEDTIAAISTAQGTGGIGIVRVSGEKTFEIGAKIFKGRKPFECIKTHTLNLGKIVDPRTGEVLDEVLLSKMVKPNTFTREDVVEINCHGGVVVLRRILELIFEMGARAAEPGEFTRRAFLNGRLDLSQAEAVIDLICAKTEESSKAAIRQLEGKLSERIRGARQKLIELIAHIEVTVDYPEHDMEEITGKMVYERLQLIRRDLLKAAASFEKGRILREGINVVIAGKPNVGKSSLLNELTGKNRAIVTDIPGTTRDIIEEYINIRGIPVKIIDTAGIRETEDVVEKIGVEKTGKALESADLVIFMLDAREEISGEDIGILEKLKGRKVIVLLNKTDLAGEEKPGAAAEKTDDTAAGAGLQDVFPDKEDMGPGLPVFSGMTVIKTSLKSGLGIEELERKVEELFLHGEINVNHEVLVTNVRHKNLIDNAVRSVDEACSAYEGGMPLDMITIDIRNAADFLGRITGESAGEDVLREIFSRFCVGK